MKYLLLLSTLLILLSCSKSEVKENPNLSYTILKSIEIPIAADVQYAHSQIQLVDEDKFVGLDQNFRKLDFFSLKENKFLYATEFKNEGPDQIYPVSSFFYHNKDSIFLFSLDASAFQIINQDGQVMKIIRMDENQYPSNISDNIVGSDKLFFPISITEMGMIHIPFYYCSDNKELIVNTIPNTELEGFNDRQSFYSAPITSNFDLQQLEFNKFSGRWPKIYDQKNTPNNPFNNFCFNKVNQDIIINFYNAADIYSLKGDKFFTVKSNNEKGDFTLFDIDSKRDYSVDEEMESFDHDEGYVNIIFDSYENLYYRIFKEGTHQKRDSTNKMEANWSLIAFNLNFEVVGEVEFPAAQYNFFQIVPTPEGLLISKESEWTKNNKENIYEFDLVKINF